MIAFSLPSYLSSNFVTALMGFKRLVCFFALAWAFASLISFLAGLLFITGFNVLSAALSLVTLFLVSFPLILNLRNWWNFYHGGSAYHPLAVSLILFVTSFLWMLLNYSILGGMLHKTPWEAFGRPLVEVFPFLFSIPNLVFTILAWKKII